MALTALEIKDKTFKTKLRGYSEEEVNEFLDIVVEDYEALVKKTREQESKIKTLEEKLSYFDEMKESLSQSVILAQETAEKVKASANAEASNLVSKANYDAQHLLDESKAKANQMLRDATDEAKRVAIETEELKRQSRVFHQRLISAIESQLSLANSSEWDELFQPTAVYLQNSDAAFKEVVKEVLNEDIPEADDSASFDATRQFTPEEMEELQRRVDQGNKELDAANAEKDSSDFDQPEINLNETQTFKLNIEK
ncbi:DivIVA domain-containing protein [Streptococcus uberis]|uniref:DivIVA domain-containing protein n=1 Tax=Streptococcus uberis TaxID=1349 RepID=UPI0006202FB4|nr:DivIVA domain-containing protein [Streptococcus uberis]KKF43307.1 cell division protein DivIVA [Streptococcus uberis C9359]KKF53333.1 cell division protein DivIVA [Streptococcus uberis C5388]KKF54360.1 cell division protein DivIVA [Streptococcus uberis B190]